MHQLPEKTNSPTKKTIYINPNFKAHINPLFMNPPPVRMIHMNPHFLENQLKHIQAQRSIAQLVDHQKNVTQSANVTTQPIAAVHINPTRKLVRNNATTTTTNACTNKELIVSSISNNKLLASKPVSVSSPTRKYKIDRRPVVATAPPPSQPPLPSQLKLIRNSVTLKKTTSLAKPPSATRSIKKQKVNERRLRLVNINGILFKSTYNKLQRKDAKVTSIKTKQDTHKTMLTRSKRPLANSLILNGSKFLMDASGFRLKRMTSHTNTSINNTSCMRQRIDIGGVTFVAPNRNDVFVRTRTHLTMAHLNNAKHRSLQLLTKHLVKSNIPCAIFQRLGKCRAYERGKCNKVHDKKQVIICPKFLQGECGSAQCLLSHNVSLSKMPVCKFYLQGMCIRTDCPYLHKKLSRTTEVCKDFLQGFCKLADQCNKRHEFICTKIDASGKCSSKKCLYCKTSSKKLQKKSDRVADETNIPTPTPPVSDAARDQNESVNMPAVRYFIGKPESDDNENINTPTMDNDVDDNMHDVTSSFALATVPRTARPKLGTLPAFIPLT